MDLDDLFPDEFDDDADHPTASPLTYRQQQALDLHKKKRNRPAFRSAEQERRRKEEELYSPEQDFYGVQGSRHVPKSAVGYKPFRWPMIRFGKFRQRSKVGFDAEMRREMGNVTHEAGVSCFRACDHQDGYLILEHDGRANWTVGFDPDKMLLPWAQQMGPQYVRWLSDGTPMDIFVIRGHLSAYGKHSEWLQCGSDGEYLLDVAKPYQIAPVSPDRLWLSSRQTLKEYYDLLTSRGVNLGLDDVD